MKNAINTANIKLIFGLKIKALRNAQGYSLQELSRRTGIAVSYLSEIESGKKYPKPGKLIQLAEALGVDYDELVSTKVSKNLDPFAALINTDLIKEFPFHLFGISASDILGLFKNNPESAHTFLQTFLQISRAYDMSLENFLFAALRTYQSMHNNYFPDLEQLSNDIREEFGLKEVLSYTDLKTILENRFGYMIDEEILGEHPLLHDLRSVYMPTQQLLINARLKDSQKAFIIARELGFLALGIEDRPQTSSWIKIKSFSQLVNNFKASYFSGALLLPQDLLAKHLLRFFGKSSWQEGGMMSMVEKFSATPEMLLYRMSQILPGVIGLKSFFYFRFTHSADLRSILLTKDLNMTDTLIPYGLGINEHYCRRWIPLRLLKNMREEKKLVSGVQRILFTGSGTRFLLMSMARPLSIAEKRGSAIALGIKIDDHSSSVIQFIDDPSIDEEVVSETCERCPLTDCSERVVEASIIGQKNRLERRESALRELSEQQSS